MYIDNVISAVVGAFHQVIDLMQTTFVFHIGIIDVSVFDICIAGIMLDLILFVAFPWYGGAENED